MAAKARGNAAFSSGDYAKAIEEFTQAINHDPTDAVFYSNRSGAYASLKKYDEALNDAKKCVELRPEFAKGYSRQGVALFGLGKLSEAKAAYEAGLKVDPNNASLKEGLTDVEKQIAAGSRPANPLGGLFGPDMWVKLQADPTTREYLKDPTFVSKLQMLQTNPSAIGQIGSDPRMSAALGVILGVGASGFTAAGAGANRGGASASSSSTTVEDEDMVDSDDDVDTSSGTTVRDEKSRSFKHVGDINGMSAEEARAAHEASKAAKEPERELSEEEKAAKAEEEARQKAEAEEKARKAAIRADADKEKELGNAVYKKRDFGAAIEHYQRAIDIDPSNIVYYNNLAAVHMEQKEYEKAIEVAQKGVEKGREVMASYKDVAKAFARMGSAYQALGKTDQAIEYLNKSLLEDYNDKTKQMLKKLEEEKRRAEELAYQDEGKSEEAKQRGNQLYNDGKFREAIAEYTEAIKRNPQNYKVYSNRAACFQKLMEWQRGLEDCDKCLSIDPNFIKAYIRKGKIQHFLKQYHKALETYDKALEIEPSNMEVMEAKRATMMAIHSGEADPERAKEAMKDPEIQRILRDPTIAKVLQDMQESPQAGAAAMRDPDIRKKIEKLIAAGVLGVK